MFAQTQPVDGGTVTAALMAPLFVLAVIIGVGVILGAILWKRHTPPQNLPPQSGTTGAYHYEHDDDRS